MHGSAVVTDIYSSAVPGSALMQVLGSNVLNPARLARLNNRSRHLPVRHS